MSKPILNLIVLRVSDLDSAAKFYSALGLTFERHRHGNGPEHYACEFGGLVFELYPRKPDEAVAGGLRIGFRVPSVDEAFAALTQAGAEIVSSPRESSWGRRAVVRDLDGYTVELTQEAETNHE